MKVLKVQKFFKIFEFFKKDGGLGTEERGGNP